MDDDLIARVRQIIAESGRTQRAFADAIDLDETKLTKSLSGVRRFSSLELAMIAQAGNRTVEWVLTGVEPRSLVFAHRSSLHDRSVADGAGRAVLEEVAERFEGLEAIGRSPATVPLPGKPTGWSYVEGGTTLAQRAIAQLGVGIADVETPDLIDLIEDRFGIDVIIQPLPEECDGLSYQDGDFRAIVLGATEVAARQRHTLAHELGHILWGDSSEGVIEEQVLQPGTKSMPEKRADAFAAAFTVPGEELLEMVGTRDPSEAFDDATWRFGVSPVTMGWRMLNLHMIDDATRLSLSSRNAAQSATAIGRLEEHLIRTQRSSQPRPPMRLAMAAVRAYLDGETAIGPAAALLGLEEEEARRMLSANDVADQGWFDNPEA